MAASAAGYGKDAAFYIARSNVCVDKAGASCGNGVFAGRDYEIGQTILALPRPLIASLDAGRLIDTCANCYTWTEGSSTGTRLYVKEGIFLQRCVGCKRKRYCSKQCQKEAWSNGHKHECKILQRIEPDKELPKGVSITMEILTRRRYGLMSDEQWQSLCSLQPHIDDFKSNGKFGDIELLATGAWNLSGTKNMFNVDIAIAMYLPTLSPSLPPTLDPLGIMVDPTLCSFNHSCDPNVYVIMDRSSVSIRTLQPVKKDKELFISYTDTTNPFARRQIGLQNRWFFICQCEKCQKGPTRLEDKWAIKPQDLNTTAQEYADFLLKRETSANVPENYVGDSLDEKRVAALQGKAFKIYEEEHEGRASAEPEEIIDVIEVAMKACHESALYHAYRQPYAALRDDLIVQLLSAGDFKSAWVHSTKRYRYILPKLYPQKAHPVRVVQTWQTAMLALYLAGEDNEITPGADMGIIAFMLIQDVAHLSTISHGDGNAFTKSVWRKFKEMVNDMREKIGPDAERLIQAQLPRQRELLWELGNLAQY